MVGMGNAHTADIYTETRSLRVDVVYFKALAKSKSISLYRSVSTEPFISITQ
jgi:hypothetical protein